MLGSTSEIKTQIKIVLAIVGLLLIFEIINLVSGRYLSQFGIIPRRLSHIPHIISAPFIHASFHHFISNILTLALFLFLTLQFGMKRFWILFIVLICITGLLVWMFARPGLHLGASGIIYGLFAYIVLAGLISKKLSLVFISLIIVFFYGGLIWGVLPVNAYVSWESHLLGALSGLLVAWKLANKRY